MTRPYGCIVPACRTHPKTSLFFATFGASIMSLLFLFAACLWTPQSVLPHFFWIHQLLKVSNLIACNGRLLHHVAISFNFLSRQSFCAELVPPPSVTPTDSSSAEWPTCHDLPFRLTSRVLGQTPQWTFDGKRIVVSDGPSTL